MVPLASRDSLAHLGSKVIEVQSVRWERSATQVYIITYHVCTKRYELAGEGLEGFIVLAL